MNKLVLSFLFFALAIICLSADEIYLQGSGTESDPYLVMSIVDLTTISENNFLWDKHFLQTVDINAISTIGMNDGAGFSPIGNNDNRFTGFYDGQGYTISNLYINRLDAYYVGLFGYTFLANISNLGITNANITGLYHVGGIVGESYATDISNSYSNGIVSANYTVGGLVGSMYQGTINNCYCTGAVNKFNTQASAGGLIGTITYGTINKCYSTATVTLTNQVGGLVGGLLASSVNDSFWDIESSGITYGYSGVGKTTAEMQDITTYLEAGWDFDNLWEITPSFNSGYPIFKRSIVFDNNIIENNATHISLTPTISLEVDDIYTSYEIYFGTDPNPYDFLTDSSWIDESISYRFEDPLDYFTDYYLTIKLYDENYTMTPLNFTFKTMPEMEGFGTEEEPYLVNSFPALIRISSDSYFLDKHYLQTANIDASDLNSGQGFDPIGYHYNYYNNQAFTGTYDGLGHIISNLYIDRSSTNYVGLFAFTDSAHIANLGLIAANIIGNNYVGSLVGSAENSSLIQNCYVSGTVVGNTEVGTIVGCSHSSTITNCYAKGSVTGSSYLGGLLGLANSSNISNCFSAASITGTSNYIGGLIGFGSANNSFWDIETSGQASSSGGAGKTTAEMQDINTYIDEGWDFFEETTNGIEDVWSFVAGDYPHLTWEAYDQLPPLTSLEIEIGDGNTTSSNLPCDLSNYYSWASYILTADQIGSSLSINELQFEVSYLNYSYTVYNQKVYLKQTNADEPSYNYPDPINSDFTLVFEGSISWTESGWQSLPLNTPFDYDGSSNLQIVWENNGNYANLEFRTTNTENNSSAFKNSDSSFPTTAGSLVSYFPNTKLIGNDLGIISLYPANKAKLVPLNPTLNLEVDDRYTRYDLSFGEIANQVTNLVVNSPIINFISYTFNQDLEHYTDYYWKIVLYDEDNQSKTLSLSFKTIYNLQGSGSEGDPFLVNDLHDLIIISENEELWDKHFRQTVDIDASATAWLNNSAGFSPIGYYPNSFTGSYDGQDCTISNLYINRLTKDDIALFGRISDATISNLGLIDLIINGNSRVGGLIGMSSNSTINNCYATGFISGLSSSWGGFGGLVGNLSSSTIDNCYSAVNVSGGSGVGSLIGQAYNSSTISNCYATGNVNGDGSAGGLVGSIQNGNMENCYATGDVNGNSFVGGLIGTASQNGGYFIIRNCFATGNVSGLDRSIGGLVGSALANIGLLTIGDCFATGDVSGGDEVGGLVGYSEANINNSYATGDVSASSSKVGGLVGFHTYKTISNCYSRGIVSGTTDSIGGLIGFLYSGSIDNSFWDIETSGQITSAGGTGKTTQEMNTLSTYLDADWDFTYLWDINETFNLGYPIFKYNHLFINLISPSSTNYSSITPTISFEVIEGYTNFELYLETDSNPNTMLISYSPITAPITYNFSNPLDYFTDYYFKVILYDLNENSTELYFTFKTIYNLQGDGTESNPYLINNFKDLLTISEVDDLWDSNFLQTADIDASATVGLNHGAGFSPIGYSGNSFTGSYNGQGHIISNLYINKPLSQGVGLFGKIYNSNISNLGLYDTEILGYFIVGGIVGQSVSSTIFNSYVTGTVSGEFEVGGLGGNVGYNSIISNCYASATVSGNNTVGGLASYSSTITNSYATGSVIGNSNVHGLSAGGSVNNSFWDIETTGQTSSGSGIGKTTQEMKTLSTYLEAGWDFMGEAPNGSQDIWTFVANDYPHLTGEGYEQQLSIPPVDLRATISQSAINLYWNQPQIDIRAFIGYKVYKDNELVTEAIITEKYFIDTDISAGQTYSYYISAIFDEEESEPSNIIEVLFYNSAMVSLEVENLQINIIDSDVHLSWDVASNELFRNDSEQVLYIISYQKDSSTTEDDYYFLDYTSDLSYMHDNIGNTNKYMFYRVNAYEGVDSGALSHISKLRSRKQKITMGEVESLIEKKKLVTKKPLRIKKKRP